MTDFDVRIDRIARANRLAIGAELLHPKYPERGDPENKPYLCEFPDGVPEGVEFASDFKCPKCVMLAKVVAKRRGYPDDFIDRVVEGSLVTSKAETDR